jgi:dipeptidyl aminopeptidase/acylaminoacyl peptidase
LRILAILAVALPSFAARPPFTPEDLWNWRQASDPRISPDGSVVAYVESWNDRERDTSFSNLWLVASDGRQRRRLTEGAWRDSSPRWSPDSKRLAWIREGDGKGSIYTAAADGGGAAPVAGSEYPVLAIAWSADGEAIAFTARVRVPPERPAWAPPSVPASLFRPGRETIVRLYVIKAVGGEPRAVATAGADVIGAPAWTLDGRSIVAACGDRQIRAFPVAGGAAPRQLTDQPGRNESPAVSPDGGRIAWLRTADDRQSYATRKLWVMNADGSRARPLSGSLDRDATAPEWSSDSRTVYFIADDRGATHVYAARNDGTVRQATNAAERLRGFSLADNGRAVTIRSTAAEAGAVYTLTVDSVSQPATLASPNEHLLAERDIGSVEPLEYKSAGGIVQAWLTRPPGFDPARRYGLLLAIQDNPRAMCGGAFDLDAQIAAARGFAVLCANPRGTPGYGESFGKLLRTALPGDDYDDLMAGVDWAVAKPYIDPGRLTATGGLLAAWAIGHTDRFRAAAAFRPIVDWAVDVLTAPGGERRARAWMGAMPWEDPDQYVKRSPLFFAGNFRTPTLVVAPESDTEAAQLYAALDARKVDKAWVKLPAEPRPADRIAAMEAVLAWLAR